MISNPPSTKGMTFIFMISIQWNSYGPIAVDSRWRPFLEENIFVLLHWATNLVRALFLSSKPSTSLVLVSSFPQYIHKITIIKHLAGIFSEKCTNKKDKLIWRKKNYNYSHKNTLCLLNVNNIISKAQTVSHVFRLYVNWCYYSAGRSSQVTWG